MAQYDKTCDVVVVGGGGSGMVAAVRAAQLTGKRVIVLEKSKQTGGGMLFVDKKIPGVFGLPPFPKTLDAALRDARQGAEKEPGKVFMADTIRDLALQLEIDPDTLEATVERYNGFCERGFDAECFKDPDCLVPCNEGPFFAVRGTLGTDGAFGGVLVNGHMQVYAENGGIIEGLFVTGDFASGRFLNMGGAKVQVLNDMSWVLASGFLAGDFAAEYVSS